MSEQNFSDETIVAQLRPRFPATNESLLGCPPIPMYSFDHPAYRFYGGVVDQLRSNGMSSEEIISKLQSKDIRHRLDQFEAKLVDLGRRFAKECLLEHCQRVNEAKTEPHWTDDHIKFDTATREFVSYDEASLEHCRSKSYTEVRDAIIIHAYNLQIYLD